MVVIAVSFVVMVVVAFSSICLCWKGSGTERSGIIWKKTSSCSRNSSSGSVIVVRRQSDTSNDVMLFV